MINPTHKMVPCLVVLENIQGLLDKNGRYKVPGRSSRYFTCYRCFEKFNAVVALEVHKTQHELDSEEEYVFAPSDSDECVIESDSDEEEKFDTTPKNTPNRISNRFKSPKAIRVVEEAVIEYVPNPTKKQAEVVEPIRDEVYAKINAAQRPDQSSRETEEANKLPVLRNIKILCLTCNVILTSSELLMKHRPLNPEKPCCFTCKICSESYAQPGDYLCHIMEHNSFSSSRSGYRRGNRRQPEFKCTYCHQAFEYRFMLTRHEDTHQKDQVVPTPVVVAQSEPELQKPIEPLPKPTADSTDKTRPRIWVIKEARMVSPEPPTPSERQKASATSGVKRKREEVELPRKLKKPENRGHGSNNRKSQRTGISNRR